MITRRKLTVDAVLFMIATIAVIAVLAAIGWLGRANAQGVGPVADPSTPTGSDVVNFLTNGQYLPAIGAVLVLVVGMARTGLGKLSPWFSTQIGGYVLSYGITTLTYVGTSLEQGQGISLKLLLTALAAALGAAGVLDHWRDAKKSIKKVPPVVGATILLFATFTMLGGSSSCGSNPPKPIADVIDCTKQDSAQIAAAEAECASKIPDWAAAEACVVSKLPTIGWQIGGCVIADLAQQYLTSKSAPLDVAQSNSAKKALEDYRANYGHNSSFRVNGQDL